MPSRKKESKRTPRACDFCRAKRYKCERDGDLNRPCGNCLRKGVECTFGQAAPEKFERGKIYMEALEKRVALMEALLAEGRANGASAHEPQETDEDFVEIQVASDYSAPSLPISILHTDMPLSSTFQDEWDGFATMPIKGNVANKAYWGKSATAWFRTLMCHHLLKGNWDGVKRELPGPGLPIPWEDSSFFTLSRELDFPAEETISFLVEIYFRHINVYWPLLCRPLVEKNIAECKHFFDLGFARTLFLICALAARYSNHPGAYALPSEPRSCGWHWFHLAQSMQPPMTQRPTLADVQFYALSGLFIFLFGTMEALSSSSHVAFGVRVLQVVGAHRKHTYRRPLSITDELWKRAFWVLVGLDRVISTCRGIPFTIQDEDLDVDFPLECDDEYWDVSCVDYAVRQPRDRLSKVSYFCAYLRLLRIDAAVARTLYSLNRSRPLFGISKEQWEQKIVGQLDSALNRWYDTMVPLHLRWDANRPAGVFRDLSMALYISYLYTRISIYQPFLLTSSRFPSLAICTHTAQECIRLSQGSAIPSLIVQHRLSVPLLSSALVMVTNILLGDHTPSVITQLELMVEYCIRMLESFQDLPIAHLGCRLLVAIFSPVKSQRMQTSNTQTFAPLVDGHSLLP